MIPSLPLRVAVTVATLALFVAAASASTVEWSTLTSTELAALPVSDFETATSTDISDIPYYACSGFQADQLAALSATALAGMTGNCVGNTNAAAWSQVQAASLAKLGYTCQYLTAAQVAKIPSSSFAGVTSSCLGYFNTEEFGTCSGITSAQVHYLTASAAGGLTQGCVKSMTTTAFEAITTPTAHAVAATACAGFSATQVGNFNVTAFAGLTSDCFTYFNTNEFGACSGITTAQLAEVSGTAAAGISRQCISSMSSTAFEDISDSFAATLTQSQCGGFASSQLGGVRAAAFGSLTRSCIAGITSQQACNALTADQLGYLTADNSGGLVSSCVSGTGGVWGKISSAALGAMADACGGFDETSMASVNPAAMAGMTPACAKSLPGSSDQPSACGALTAAQIGYLTAGAGAGLKSQCIGATGSVWGEASTALIGSLGSACIGFDSTNLHSVRPTSFVAWKASCTSMWSSDDGYGPCVGITATQMSYMDTAAVAGLTGSCVSALVDDAFSQVTSAQLHALSDSACIGMTAALVHHTNPAAFSGLSSQCMALMDSSCSGFTRQGLRVVPPATLEDLKSSCMNHMQSPTMWNNVTAAQVAALTDSACIGMTAAVTSGLMPAAFHGFTPTCTHAWSNGGIEGSSPCQALSGAKFAALNPAAVHGLRGCVGALPSDALSVASRWQLQELSSEACIYLPAGAIQGAASEAVAGLTAPCIHLLPDSSCAGFTADGIAGILPSNFTGFASGCVEQVHPTSWAKLTADQLSYLGSQGGMGNGACGGLGPKQFAAIPSAAVTGLRRPCANDLAAACAGVSVADWAAMSPSLALPWLTNLCTSQLSDAVLDAVTLTPQLSALSASGFAGFSAAQLERLYNRLGSGFLATVTEEQTSSMVFATVQAYKALYRDGSLSTALTAAGMPSDPQHVSLLQVAALDDMQVASLTSNFACSVQYASWGGWRGSQVVNMPAAWFSNVTFVQLSRLYAIRNITAAQLAAVTPQAFATFAHHAIPTYPGAHLVALIPIPAIQALTAAQLAALTPYEFRAFSKEQLEALTAGQRAGLTTQQKAEIKALVGGGPLPPPPTNDDDHHHHTTNDDDHHTTNDDDHHTTGQPSGGGLSGGIIALIVIGVLAVAGGFGAAFYVKVWKPRSQGSGDFYAMRDQGV